MITFPLTGSVNLVNNLGTVNSAYYISSIFNAPTLLQQHKEFNLVFQSRTWNFLETLFKHHLALLLPFLLAILVPVSGDDVCRARVIYYQVH